MHKLYNIKEKFMKELGEYADKPTYSGSDVETVKNLISSINKICEYMDAEEEKEEYSGRMSRRGGSYNSYDGSYDGSYGGSYARGRRGNVRRDAMGRYSREDGYSRHDIADKLYEVMDEAPEHMKGEIKQMVDKLQRM